MFFSCISSFQLLLFFSLIDRAETEQDHHKRTQEEEENTIQRREEAEKEEVVVTVVSGVTRGGRLEMVACKSVSVGRSAVVG